MSRASGVTRGLDGAIQRVVVNGHAVEHIMERATDSAGVSRYQVSQRLINATNGDYFITPRLELLTIWRTGIGQKAVPRLDACYSCCCLPLLP